jgi:predicted GH43/DUF377 family glycosyl hydrolase
MCLWLGPFKKYEGNPVLRAGPEEWDSVSVRQNGLWKEGDIYYLFYSGEYSSNSYDHHWQIGVATSEDMIHWEKYDGNPILTTGKIGEWDSFWVMYPDIQKIRNTYYMTYMGCHMEKKFIPKPRVLIYTERGPAPPWHMEIGVATSKDLINWRKYERNPVLSTGDAWTGPEWDSCGIYDHSVLFYKGVYYMAYGGSRWQGQGSIGIATSKDLINWRKYERNPVVSMDGPQGVLECTELFEYSGFVHMLYVYWDDPGPRTMNLGGKEHDTQLGNYNIRGKKLVDPRGRQVIGLMSSPDMIQWIDYPIKPVLNYTEPWEGSGVSDRSSGVGSPAAIIENDTLKVIYHGGSYSNWSNGYAEAKLYRNKLFAYQKWK